jgi:hypothetical protein
MSPREFAKRRDLLASRLPIISRYVRPRFGSEILTDADGDPYVQFISTAHHYASLSVGRDGRNRLFVIERGPRERYTFLTGRGPRAIGRTLAKVWA